MIIGFIILYIAVFILLLLVLGSFRAPEERVDKYINWGILIYSILWPISAVGTLIYYIIKSIRNGIKHFPL